MTTLLLNVETCYGQEIIHVYIKYVLSYCFVKMAVLCFQQV